MRYPHQYVVLPVAAVTDRMVDDCVQTGRTSVRVSADGLSSILKYRGAKPGSLGLRGVIDHAEALALMDTADWNGAV